MWYRIENLWLALILLTAGVLRFFNYSEIPFTQDELSALLGAQEANSWATMWSGVVQDYHPPGTHMLLYLITTFFGTEEWMFKLPFTLASLGSIWIVYLIGKLWFRTETGLWAAAFLAVTQFFIFYGQIARPYALALFTTLLAVLFWSRYLFKSTKKWDFNLIGWILAASASAYIHYFALLFVILVGITGLLILRVKRWIPYILSGIWIFILFLPALPIFLEQFSRGGLDGWLGKPEPDFVLSFLSYTLQYSWVFGGSILLLFVIGLFIKSKEQLNLKKLILGLFWFIIIYLTGYYYSIYRSPILQFSGLFFVFPYLLLSLFSLFTLSKKWLGPGLLILIASGTYALVKERKHYDILYNHSLEHLVKQTSDALKKYPNAAIIMDGIPKMTDRYLEEYKIELSDIDQLFDLNNKQALVKAVGEGHSKSDYLALSTLHFTLPEIVSIVQSYFPFLELHESHYQGDFYLFSKGKSTGKSLTNHQTLTDLSNSHEWMGDWKSIPLVTDTMGNTFFPIDSTKTGSPSIILTDPNQYLSNANDLFTLELKVKSFGKPTESAICSAYFIDDSLVEFKASLLSDFVSKNAQTNDTITFRAFHGFKTPKSLIGKSGAELKLYLWNLDSGNYQLSEIKLHQWAGNPKLFGLFDPILD